MIDDGVGSVRGEPALAPSAEHARSNDRAVNRATVSTPLKVLAIFHITLALAGLVAGGWMCASFWMIPGRLSNTILAFAFPVFLFFTIFLLLPGLAGGIGLLLGRPWARILLLLLSGLMLLVVPVGTLLGGAGIWVLLSDRPRRAAASPEATQSAGTREPWITAGYGTVTLLVLAAAAAAGVLVLGAVFRFQEQEPPPALHDLLPGAMIVLPSAILLAVLIAVATRVRRDRTVAASAIATPTA